MWIGVKLCFVVIFIWKYFEVNYDKIFMCFRFRGRVGYFDIKIESEDVLGKEFLKRRFRVGKV